VKRKFILCAFALVVLAISGYIAWWLRPLPPEVRFVRFLGCNKGFPVMRVTNHSRSSYSYLGTGPSLPYFRCRSPRVPTRDVDDSPLFGLMGDPTLQILTLPPNSSIEVTPIVLGSEPHQEPFQVGIYFLQGTKKQILERQNRQPGPIKQILIELGLLRSGYGIVKPETIWSDTVTP